MVSHLANYPNQNPSNDEFLNALHDNEQVPIADQFSFLRRKIFLLKANRQVYPMFHGHIKGLEMSVLLRR